MDSRNFFFLQLTGTKVGGKPTKNCQNKEKSKWVFQEAKQKNAFGLAMKNNLESETYSDPSRISMVDPFCQNS